MPEFQPPTFNGATTEWPDFAALFMDSISRYNISESQKFHLLNRALKGPARTVIACMTLSENSFTEAWKLLKAKYENKRDIIQTIVQKVLNPARDSTFSEIETLIDSTRQALESLKLLGRPITAESDTWVVPFTLLRLRVSIGNNPNTVPQLNWQPLKIC